MSTSVSTWPLLTAEELEEIPPVDWIVKGVLPEQSNAFVFGRDDSSKSGGALDVGLSIALGIESVLGATNGERRVHYLAGEGAPGMRNRVRAWKQAHGIETVGSNFLFSPVIVNLLDPKSVDKYIRTATEAVPDVVIVDTFASAFPGGDENGPRDMSTALTSLRLIRSKLNCCTVTIHHTGKNKDAGARGHSSLKASADVMIQFERFGEKPVVKVECVKMKDFEKFPAINLRSVAVSLGNGASSYVLARNMAGPALNPGQRRQLGVLRDAGCPLRAGDWLRASGHSAATFYRNATELVTSDLVSKQESTPGTVAYEITTKGRTVAGEK